MDSLLFQYRRIIGDGGPAREVLSQLVGCVFASFAEYGPAITLWQDERPLLEKLPGFDCVTNAEAEAERLWTKVILQGIEGGVFRPDLDPQLAYRIIRDAIWMVVRWYRPDGPLSTQELAEQYVAILLDGIDSRSCYSGARLDASQVRPTVTAAIPCGAQPRTGRLTCRQTRPSARLAEGI